MPNPHALLLIIAFVVFLIGLLDWPPVSTVRCIALGLALLTLALIQVVMKDADYGKLLSLAGRKLN